MSEEEIPRRRSCDSMFCPFHEKTTEDIDRKLDLSIFKLFVTSVMVVLALAAGAFGWLSLEVIKNSKHTLILNVNQQRLMRYFDVPTVKEAKEAKDILKNGDN